MKVRAMLAVLATLAMCFLAARSAADDLKETASFKVSDRLVRAVALSPDGTRLAAAVGYEEGVENKTRKQNLNEVIIWDLTTSAQISRHECPGVSFLFFSANGRTLITVDEGFNNEGGSARVRGGLRTRHGYQAWDAATGQEIGSRIAPAQLGEFTTTAVSPDGKYLATVFNAETTIGRSLSHPFLVREVSVWDLQAHEVKWKLPGVMTPGRVTWSDSLAFSPDGKQLAFAIHGSSGPSSESTTKARPDRPDANVNKLKMLTLDEGKEEPAVAVLEMAFPIEGSLQWISGGKYLVGRGSDLEARQLDVRDPATGQRRATLALPFPHPKPSKARGNTLPTPTPAPDSMEAPFDWYETQAILSADGSRLAAHFFHELKDESKPRQNWIAIWDVPGRKVLGAIALPDDRATAAPRGRRIGFTSKEIRLALSGNGGRLAVGSRGAVRLYDVAKISGIMKVQENSLPAAASDAAAVRKTYEAAVLQARERLLATFDQKISRIETASNDKARSEAAKDNARKEVAILKDGKERFDKHDLVSWSESIGANTAAYLTKLLDARAAVLASYGTAELPADLRDLIDKRVIARWTHEPGGAKITLYSSGSVNDPDDKSTWSFSNGRLTLRWQDAKAPGGYWVDTCILAHDGQSYSGANQNKTKVSGTLVMDE